MRLLGAALFGSWLVQLLLCSPAAGLGATVRSCWVHVRLGHHATAGPSLPPALLPTTCRDRRQGRDHIWLFTHDEGSCWAPAAIKNSIILSHWG